MSKVTVIIPCYNTGQYLAEAIQSVLDQTFDDFEAIVVDDGSTDNTAEVVRDFDDPRVRYVRQANKGLAGARNTGLCLARGEYVAFLDADDWFSPDKLTCQVQLLDSEPRFGLVAGAYAVTGATGTISRTIRGWENSQSLDISQLLLGNPLGVPTVLVRRSWISSVGGFNKTYRRLEDWDLWLRLARAGCRMRWHKDTVAYYRRHDANMSHDVEGMKYWTFRALDDFYSHASPEDPILDIRLQAYAEAHLDGFMRNLSAGNAPKAVEDLIQAISVNPDLLQKGGQRIIECTVSAVASTNTSDPLALLNSLLETLPNDLACVFRRKGHVLGLVHMEDFYAAYEHSFWPKAEAAFRHAIRHDQTWLLNLGAMRMYLNTITRMKVTKTPILGSSKS